MPTRANGGISSDGRRITYRIRTGRWSDGASFDARDVGFTIDALRNPKTAVPDTSAVADVLRWSAPRPDTLVVQLRQPSAPSIASFLTLGANDPFAILPRHIAAKYASLDQSSLDTNPVGLGPFKLLQWQRGTRLSFVRNPYYWRGPAASPRIDVAVVPDAQTRLLLARTGEIDLTEVTGFGVDVGRTIASASVVRKTTNVVDYLQFNLHTPALRDVAVRRAIAMAIDRVKLASAVYRGTLVPSDSVQIDPRFRTPARLPAYDPAKAAAVLKKRHITIDLAIAGGWRNSSNVAVQLVSQLADSRRQRCGSTRIPRRNSGDRRIAAAFWKRRVTISRSRRGRLRWIRIARIFSDARPFRRVAATRCSTAITATMRTKPAARSTTNPNNGHHTTGRPERDC